MILSTVIVTYNHENDIKTCLTSLGDHLSIRPAEIIVVDNHSQDRTIAAVEDKRFRLKAKSLQLRILRNSTNTGFTHASNQGLRMAGGKFVLLLNPDTQITPQSIEKMIHFLSNNPNAGAVAPQLHYPDGSIQPSCRRFPQYRYLLSEAFGLNRLFPKTKLFNGWRMGDFDHTATRDVDQPQGACLLLTKSIGEQIGWLDERFVMFFSDVDFCRRIKQIGKKIYFYSKSTVVHRKGSSIYNRRTKMIRQSHQDFIRYFLKWYRSPTGWLCTFFGIPFLIILGSVRWSYFRVKERIV
ncbi:MAG TPA: glycosyltransferase family 2 protein [Bacteroidetes bacterium]|nr:glycosyltransferase family 2 protein [Bacteroidota bacterium]